MSDMVSSPSHYAEHYPVEVINMIRRILDGCSDNLTPFQSYCLGNEIKYRMRAGFKNDAEEDIAKAMMYYGFRTGKVDP